LSKKHYIFKKKVEIMKIYISLVPDGGCCGGSSLPCLGGGLSGSLLSGSLLSNLLIISLFFLISAFND
jgi:hypothetical protein